MLFCSAGLLEKHKARFCIGSEVGGGGHLGVQRHSSDLLMGDKPGCVEPKQTKTPDLVQVRHAEIVNESKVRGDQHVLCRG